MTETTSSPGSATTPGPRRAATLHRRDEILQAALVTFTAHGYELTTMEDIRQRSGASIGSIYHHFGSKQELAAELFIEGLSGYQQGAVERLAALPGAREGIEGLVRHYLEWDCANVKLARYLLSGRADEVRMLTSERLAEINRLYFGAVNEWLRGHIASGQIRKLPAELYNPLWHAPAQQFARGWLANPQPAAMEAAITVLPGAAWRALRGDGTPAE